LEADEKKRSANTDRANRGEVGTSKSNRIFNIGSKQLRKCTAHLPFLERLVGKNLSRLTAFGEQHLTKDNPFSLRIAIAIADPRFKPRSVKTTESHQNQMMK